MDQIVSKFNVVFYTDNEQEECWHKGETYDMKEGIKSAMLRHGDYKIIDIDLGLSEVPVRTMEEYTEDQYKECKLPTISNNNPQGEDLPF